MNQQRAPVRPFPMAPSQPHRLCWGCDRYCAHDRMLCGNGPVRTPHPIELFGPDWWREGMDASTQSAQSQPEA